MAGKQAKILNDKQLAQLLAYASTTRYSRRNRVIVLLSVKAGLRAGEIAKLTWDMVLDPSGQLCSDRIARLGGEEEKRPHDPPARRSGRRPSSMDDRNHEFWARHSVRTGRPDDPNQHRQLVQERLRALGLCWLQFAFGPAYVHHPGGPAGSRGRRFIAGRSTACRPSINPNNSAVH